MKKLITIRTDASLQIGSGHVTRCLTLAEVFRKFGYEVWFICREHPGNLNEMIRNKDFVLKVLAAPEMNDQGPNGECGPRAEYRRWMGVPQNQDAYETITVLQGELPVWMIIDHYGLDLAWEERLRPHVRKIMVIDDLADRPHDCDVLLDQNVLGDTIDPYHELVPPFCTKLLGQNYALLRPEFAEVRKLIKPRTGEVHRVFVFFGSSDPENYTSTALEALSAKELSELSVDVVLGSINPNRAVIERMVAARPKTNLHVQVDNMAELMACADLALVAGGSTTWERFCIGLPGIVTVLSENQRQFSEALDKAGLQICLGSANGLDAGSLKMALMKQEASIENNRSISEKSWSLVDGKGLERVGDLIMKGISTKDWQIQEATKAEENLFWHWANDVEVRSNAYNTESISWEEHQNWFQKKLNDSSTVMLVVESSLGKIGQVRFDREGDYYVIDFSISRHFRGLGMARELLRKAIEIFWQRHQNTLVGKVREQNLASAKVFENLGFQSAVTPKSGFRHYQLRFSPSSFHA